MSYAALGDGVYTSCSHGLTPTSGSDGRRFMRRSVVRGIATFVVVVGAALLLPASSLARPYPTSLPEVSFESGQYIAQAEPGTTLECGSGSWAGYPESFEYEWLRNGVPITLWEAAPGGVFYTIQQADSRKSLTCEVKALSEGQSTEAESSNSVAVGGAGPPENNRRNRPRQAAARASRQPGRSSPGTHTDLRSRSLERQPGRRRSPMNG